MKYRTRLWVCAALTATSVRAQGTNPFGIAVRELLAGDTARSDRLVERTTVARVYASGTARPMWSVLGAGPTHQALVAMDVLASSAGRGLDPASYDVLALRGLADSATRSPTNAARFDVSLTRAVTRLIIDLHMGRTDPTTVRFALPNAHEHLDVAALVTAVSEAADVPAALTRMEPPYAGYHALQRALARYRALAGDSTVRPPSRPKKTVRPGDPFPDAPALTRFLEALGDIDLEDASQAVPKNPTPPRYEGALVDAVVRFQRRHGLAPDSVIGPATMGQLRVPLAQRVRQIELTLERWRWLPDRAPARFIVVNIPGFRLYAFAEDSLAQRPRLAMNVIVGQAEGRHDTPVFTATMGEVVFRPYWDVPPRIARTELIPTFRRRPAYFESEGFEIVRRGTGDVPATTFAPTAANFARILSGQLRLRQRPGPANALGYVKFLFPNPYNVYLHGTPAQQLFAESRRDFSHGCIRTEQPGDLAELVLQGQAPWSRATIDSVMSGDQTVHVPIARPFTVFVLYATVVVDSGGTISFYPDLYRHDAALERTLRLTPLTALPSPAVAR